MSVVLLCLHQSADVFIAESTGKRISGVMATVESKLFEQISGNEEKTQQSSRKVGLVLVGLTGGAAIGLSIIAAPFVAPALRKICLPYVPATTHQVNNVLRALKGRTGTLVDLGSGDGRIVVAAAKSAKLTGVGVELNPWLVWYSRWLAWKKGVSSSTSFMTHDLWKLNLQQYKNVVIFGVEEMMPDLESKLFQELTADGCVVACRFPLPTWQPIATFGEGIDTVWLYRRPNEDNVQHREDDESFVDNR